MFFALIRDNWEGATICALLFRVHMVYRRLRALAELLQEAPRLSLNV